MILLPIFQIFGTYVFVLTLCPIILGIADHPEATWSLPWVLIIESPLTALKIIGTMILVVILLIFIPLLNSFRTIYSLALGGTVMAFVVGLIDYIEPYLHVLDIYLIP